jgi:hypothetical protein
MTEERWIIEISPHYNTVGVATEHGQAICELFHGLEGWTNGKPTSKEWKIKQGRLIAAAPQMLEALKRAEFELHTLILSTGASPRNESEVEEARQLCRAAILTATDSD